MWSDGLNKPEHAGKPVVVTARNNTGRYRTRDQGCICDPNRILRPLFEPFNGDIDISTKMGPVVSKKAFSITVATVDPTTQEETVRELGQVSLLKIPQQMSVEDAADSVVVPVTVKDNLSSLRAGNAPSHTSIVLPPHKIYHGVAPGPQGPTNADLHDVSIAMQKSIEKVPKKCFRVTFGNLSAPKGDIPTKLAVEDETIVQGDPIASSSLLGRSTHHYEKVRDEFQCQVGQSIGMVVYSEVGATPESAGDPSMSQAQVNVLFGVSCQVNVYSGKVLAVKGKYMEHNINTYANCSGTVVFLTDKNTAENGVLEEDIGKAIAVHSELLSNENEDSNPPFDVFDGKENGNVAILL